MAGVAAAWPVHRSKEAMGGLGKPMERGGGGGPGLFTAPPPRVAEEVEEEEVPRPPVLALPSPTTTAKLGELPGTGCSRAHFAVAPLGEEGEMDRPVHRGQELVRWVKEYKRNGRTHKNVERKVLRDNACMSSRSGD